MNLNAKTLFAAEIELLNISAGGACIKARQSLRATDKQLVKLESEATRLTLPFSVVWENVSSDTAEPAEKCVPSYSVGVSFMDMPPDKLVMLKDFIRKSGTPYEQRLSDAYKPGLLRFTVHANKQALVFYTRTLPVKKIGLGGMLVELAGDIQPGEVFPMELFIPDETGPTRFRGRIASRIPLPERGAGRFDIGVEFLDMTSADKFRLSKFLLFSRISPET